MYATRDPGIWLVVAMLACVQFTIWLGRRIGGPINWEGGKRLLALIPFVACLGFYRYASPSEYPTPVGPFCIPVICGLYLALRLRLGAEIFTAFLVSVITASVLGSWSNQLAEGPLYMDGTERWVVAEDGRDINSFLDGLASRIPESSKVEKASIRVRTGYLQNRRAWGDNSTIGAVEHLIPKPAWHHFLTGLSYRTSEAYQIWTPGGAPEDALSKARLVRIGPTGEAPKVAGPKPGIPIPGAPKEINLRDLFK